jgi:hypothetical protein
MPLEFQENRMSLQGHIENGMVMSDETESLPNGTVVGIEPVEASKEMADSGEPVLADTDQPHPMQQMAHAWKAITKPMPPEDVPLSVDPDDYPLF